MKQTATFNGQTIVYDAGPSDPEFVKATRAAGKVYMPLDDYQLRWLLADPCGLHLHTGLHGIKKDQSAGRLAELAQRGKARRELKAEARAIRNIRV